MKKSFIFLGSLLFIAVFSVILYAYAMFQGGFVSWFLFFCFLPIFIYQICLLCYPVRGLKITRTFVNEEIFAGGSISALIQIKRRIPFPLYYCMVEEIIPQTLQQIDRGANKYVHLSEPGQLHVRRQVKKVVFPWFKKRIEIPYELNHLPRGEHQLFAIRLKMTDIFGFINKVHTFSVKDKLIVSPADRLIYLREDIQGTAHGAKPAASFHLQHHDVVSGVREYVSGDRLSWIDWKQTARSQSFMTKEFVEEKNIDILCVLDGQVDANSHILAFEGAIEVVLGLVKSIQQHKRRVDFLAIDSDSNHFSSEHGELAYQAIHKYLARVQPSDSGTFPSQLFDACMYKNDYASLMIVTTNLNDQLLDHMYKINRKIKQISIIFIQASDQLTEQHRELVSRFEREGILICRLTEHELINDPIEVNL